VLGTHAALAEQLASGSLPRDIVTWAAPVPFFGNISRAHIATIGINPSNLEFVDGSGHELTGARRRLETLRSLDLPTWSQADGGTVRTLARSCIRYFQRNPYRKWFDVLDRILSVSGNSYYGPRPCAHVDLVPYATVTKWGQINRTTRYALLDVGRAALAETISASAIRLLVLNGRSVVDAFAASTMAHMNPVAVPLIDLPRAGRKSVPGVKWEGTVTSIAGYDLGREVRVIGFNHNVQSSFGVTTKAMQEIGNEIGAALG